MFITLTAPYQNPTPPESHWTALYLNVDVLVDTVQEHVVNPTLANMARRKEPLSVRKAGVGVWGYARGCVLRCGCEFL